MASTSIAVHPEIATSSSSIGLNSPASASTECQRAAAGIRCLKMEPAQPGQFDRTERISTHPPTSQTCQTSGAIALGESDNLEWNREP